MERFDLDEFCAAAAQHRCTRAHLVPPIVLGLLNSSPPMAEKYDLSSFEMIVSAAAPLGAEVERRTGDVLGCGIKQAWGMSELSPLGTFTPDDGLKPATGTIGPAVSENGFTN